MVFDKIKKVCIIKIENESHRNVCYHINYDKTPQSLAEHMWCFYYLLKITTIAIIKANAIIVIPTKPQKSKYIINNIACSTIQHHPHSHSQNCVCKVVAPTLLILIFYVYQYTTLLDKIQANKTNFQFYYCNL